MPLRDHFRSPVNNTHSWDELHGQWPGEIVRDLKPLLPPGFRTAPQVHFGSPFEVVVAYDLDSREPDSLEAGNPTYTVEAELADQDEYEVRVYDTERGRKLVAVIEIISPSNKDRPETRELFVGKVGSLFQQDVCVSLVDLVTVRRANLYADLLTLFGGVDPQLAPTPPNLYAVSVRARRVAEFGWMPGSIRWRSASPCRRCRFGLHPNNVSCCRWRKAIWRRAGFSGLRECR